MPPIKEIIDEAHSRDILIVVDGAQLAPHRPLPREADFVAWSGHKMYAPFGAGVLVGPRRVFEDGDPFLAGGGAVDLVELDDVVWTAPPDREEAGSPNVIGAVALHAAIDAITEFGWDDIIAHDAKIGRLLRTGLAEIAGVRVLGPDPAVDTLPVASFTIENIPHALVAARLSAENGIGVRHGCFCAHPYLMRLLGFSEAEVAEYRNEVRRGDRSRMPGAVRASAGINTTEEDVSRLVQAVARIAGGEPTPVDYVQDRRTGDFIPSPEFAPWYATARSRGASCSPG
jgi:selenocysteine lyase/cysteine desulfurase